MIRSYGITLNKDRIKEVLVKFINEQNKTTYTVDDVTDILYDTWLNDLDREINFINVGIKYTEPLPEGMVLERVKVKKTDIPKEDTSLTKYFHYTIKEWEFKRALLEYLDKDILDLDNEALNFEKETKEDETDIPKEEEGTEQEETTKTKEVDLIKDNTIEIVHLYSNKFNYIFNGPYDLQQVEVTQTVETLTIKKPDDICIIPEEEPTEPGETETPSEEPGETETSEIPEKDPTETETPSEEPEETETSELTESTEEETNTND